MNMPDVLLTALVVSFIAMMWVAIGVVVQELIKNYKRGG